MRVSTTLFCEEIDHVLGRAFGEIGRPFDRADHIVVAARPSGGEFPICRVEQSHVKHGDLVDERVERVR